MKWRTIDRGFTLIELVLAVAIFSFIALAGTYLLRQTIRGAAQQVEIVNNTSQLQQALWLLSQDMYNLIDRPAKIGTKLQGTVHSKQEGEDDYLGSRYKILFHFTRLSWIDTRYKYTSQLLRVAYALKQSSNSGSQQLVRLHWPHVDRFKTQKPFERILIDKVRKAKASFFAKGQKDISRWPNTKSDEGELPDGLILELDIENYGKFEKIISVNLNTLKNEGEEEEGEGDKEKDDDEN